MGARPNKEGGSGPFAAKRSRASFCDAGPRTSSVGTPCFRPSNANNAGSGRGSSTCSASSEYQCAGHAPYAISIPSRVGSPLSFTQPFLASRTSMYEKPPSSQIRAAHIDWDGLMEERAACNNANSVNGANNANCDDWPMWQPQQQSHGASVPLDMACSNPRLSSAVVFKSHIAQHQQPQQQHCAPRQPALPIQPSSCSTNAPCPHLPWHACPVVTADPANGSAASAIVASGISGAPGAGTRVAHNDPECLLLMQELEQLQEWDFACQHHPLLMSFSAASQQKLSAAWRNTLLVALAASVLCVVAGVPLALALLASKEDSLLLAHKG
ncbi:hypothetical protein GGI12_004696 [Dipsacomyces acuminosporus]|nr:hypothetical protein GGI12_004696 [Dipsacomyces acuminosporus]